MNAIAENDVFIDTNILVYAYDLSAGNKHSTAQQFMNTWWEKGNGCLSMQVLQEYYVTVTQKIIRPLSHLLARQIISDLAHWRIHTPDPDDLLQAIDLQHEYQLSFWDAMIIQSASHLGCRRLYSEDFSHGQFYAGVQAINPLLKE